MSKHHHTWRCALLVAVAALGYFVDVYDLLLFSVVRTKSLTSLGIAADQTLNVGLNLLNIQMIGLLVGGFLWGMLGDRRGRLSVLFGSIVLYSVANLANAFVTNVTQYEALRLLAGIGLAGELGAGISIVSETMSAEFRGIGTMIVAAVGLLGAVAASLVGQAFDWRTAFLIGGVMGIALLLLRIGAFESGLYTKMVGEKVSRGNVLQLFTPWKRFVKFLSCICIGLPVWYVIGILVTAAPEFGTALGVSPLPVAGTAVMACYIGLSLGDVLCSGISQLLKSRRKAFAIFFVISLASILWYLYLPAHDLTGFYIRSFAAGLGVGFWALFVTNASEQFGTNLRATATTATPNLVRGSLVPITIVFTWLKAMPSVGIVNAAGIVGVATVFIALLALAFTKERFGTSLDFVEH